MIGNSRALHLTLLVFLLFQFNWSKAQYYIAGTCLIDSAKPAPYIYMRLHSTGIPYRSGALGDFGIPSKLKTDTVTCWAYGFDTIVLPVYQGKKNLLMIPQSKRSAKKQQDLGRLTNLTPNLPKGEEAYYEGVGETYLSLVENQFIQTEKFPLTGFSPNSNKASYANVRRFLQQGKMVNPNAVRIEELLNYFSLSWAPPVQKDKIFSFNHQLTNCPWNGDNKLLFLQIKAKDIESKNTPPANLVFLIDNSGSMDQDNRMPLLKSAFSKLIGTLRPIDRVAIVTYGGTAGIWLPPTFGTEKDKMKMLKIIDELPVGGATAGSNGIDLAYQLATTMPIPNANNRVILATDGDFNVGITAENELETLITKYSKTGVKLTCLGIGMGNYKDSKIETLARYGSGNYAYIDNEQEGEKVFVTELTQNLYAVANDVSIYLTFNPEIISRYKLIGYENRKGAVMDDDARLIGGEIGAGFPLNAIFELTMSKNESGTQNNNERVTLGKLLVQYIDSQKGESIIEKDSTEINWNELPLDQTQSEIQLAASIAIFGSILRKSSFSESLKFENIIELSANQIDTTQWQQVQFIDLVHKAMEIYTIPEPIKRKKIFGRRKKDL